VDRHQPLRDQIALNHAVTAVQRTVGLALRVVEKAPTHRTADVFIETDTPAGTIRFAAEIKTVRHFATLAMVREQLAALEPGVNPLLVAPYITRALAERCRALQLPFIDTAGNAFINIPGLTIFVTGEPRPKTLLEDPHYRAYTALGLKVIFALLCQPELADGTYRQIAQTAKVALGPLGPVLKDLQNRGYLVERQKKKVLVHTGDLMEAWVTRYPDTLRPKLFLNRYQADTKRLQDLNLPAHKAFWGAEVAAQQLTGYLQPEHFALYVRGDDNPLLTAARMRLDRNGNTELLQAFWDFPADPAHPDLVPPLLVYADLMATGDGRNLETARLVYERFLEPTLRP
jgi:hypothetical protein